MRIEGEIPTLVQVDRHRLRAVRRDLRLVDRKPRVGVDNFIARAVVRGGEDGVREERPSWDFSMTAFSTTTSSARIGSPPRTRAMYWAAADLNSSMPAEGV